MKQWILAAALVPLAVGAAGAQGGAGAPPAGESRLPKETRAELHERFADWLDTHVALVEQDEIVGYHLEQAHRNLAELDGADPRLDGLARRAATRLGTAADTAELRGDYGALSGLVSRAIALLP